MSSRTNRVTLYAISLGALVLAPPEASAQLGKIGQKIKEKAAQAADKQKSQTADKGDQAVAKDTSPPQSIAGGRKVWVNYDFIPGQRTLFFTDFTDEIVGNFPRRLQFKSGSMEIVELDGQRALKATTASGFVVPLAETLPEKFTLEIDVINLNSLGVGAPTIKVYGGTAAKTDVDTEKTRVAFGHLGWDVTGGGTESQGSFTSDETEAFVGHAASVRVLGDGAYLKVYADGRRLANVPNASFARGKGIFVALEGRDEESNAVYVTRIRVAESQKTVYDALATAGRWATQGILFETGKSMVRPESAPTLKEIAAALTQHPELRIRIEGHTDNVGSADANLRLSEARAGAVKDALVKDYRIDPARLETAGLGDTKPVADNKTPEGRSSNRRVEVVKL
jgi:outer membrane protein OmpA-like peptidoglycan-associated protein